MMTAALVEAQKVGVAVSLSTLVCNAFNPQGKGIAFVLWVFYLSKVGIYVMYLAGTFVGHTVSCFAIATRAGMCTIHTPLSPAIERLPSA
jgi:hypothetical protein